MNKLFNRLKRFAFPDDDNDDYIIMKIDGVKLEANLNDDDEIDFILSVLKKSEKLGERESWSNSDKGNSRPRNGNSKGRQTKKYLI